MVRLRGRRVIGRRVVIRRRRVFDVKVVVCKEAEADDGASGAVRCRRYVLYGGTASTTVVLELVTILVMLNSFPPRTRYCPVTLRE